jgi:AcrR family transcriptional regulator
MSSVESLPEFRRPTAEDVLPVALWLFERGERVDMNTVATRLGVGRTTLYRWAGDREQLIDRVILASIGGLWQRARAQAKGDGLELVLDAIARFVMTTATYDPLVQLAQREPEVVLRLLLDRDGLATRAIAAGFAREIEEHTSLEVPDEVCGVLALAGNALVWANVAAGREPDIDAIITLVRTVLTAHGSTAAARQRRATRKR